MSIVLDTREQALFKYFPDCEKKQFDIGDIHITFDNGRTIVIERKTLQDLQASIRDGRYREQKQRLLQSGCEIWYIFEGSILSSFSSVSYKAIISAMMNCIIRDKISVFRTKDPEETSFIIKKLAENINPTPSSQEIIPISISMKKSGNITPDEVFISQLCCIPGISRTLALLIKEQFPNMSSLVNADVKKLTSVNKIGKKKANSILSYVS